MDIMTEARRFLAVYRDPRTAADIEEAQAIQRAFCAPTLEPATLAECKALIAVVEVDLLPWIERYGVGCCLASLRD